ncbi:MAG: SDR family oxidoreductase [bacterium]|nr:SDR family oxidoreductase [bacterium]
MADRFAGKKYLVTGGASGIGLATAQALFKRGAQLALWDVNAPALEEAAGELVAFPAWVDVTRHEVEPAMRQVREEMGGLDGVIHCAGILHTGLFEQIDRERHQRMVEVNLGGTLAVAHAALPFLRESKGSLVMMGSVSGFYGPPEYASYAATKAGVLNFAQAIRIEVESAGVHVGVVTPNLVDTPMLSKEVRENAHLMSSKSPLMETSSADLIAKAILRGLRRRDFMIYPTWRVRVVHWLTRYAAWSAHALMRRTWRNAGGGVQ